MMHARAGVIYNPSTLLACRVRGDQEKVPSCRDSMHARVWFEAHRVLAQDYHVRKVRYNSRARPPERAARGDPGGDHMTDVICGMRHGLCELASLTGAKGSSTNRRGRGSGSEGMPTPMNESTSQQMGLAFVTCLRRPFGRGYHGRQGLSGTQ
ncbi:hypothetical protein OOU_Y34scaffold00624g76 [Pyricularia oryzae Y34]|uniref:Uncharacterized protein n=2 Tax=Pyricularia oryzae TaxID=318829 RepID=A0AA97NV55_PYRO3|nr:hypothetical protein OOU_Y34scaffold00624g76 [Pyricularia oryzae Y34]